MVSTLLRYIAREHPNLSIDIDAAITFGPGAANYKQPDLQAHPKYYNRILAPELQVANARGVQELCPSLAVEVCVSVKAQTIDEAREKIKSYFLLTGVRIGELIIAIS